MRFIGWTRPPAGVTIGSMSEPDAVPLPREGEVFFDVRGESRTMRLSWYADSSVAVFSIWQGNRCAGTFRLPFVDLVRMVDTLRAGPPSRLADPASLQAGQPPYSNARPDAGYGYPEPSDYGQPTTYAPAHGYGSEPPYGREPDYGYPEPYDGMTGHGGGEQHYDHDYPAASSGRDYGPPDRYGAPDDYGGPEPYGPEFDQVGPPRYVPDVAGQVGSYQGTADYVPESQGYAEPPGHAQSRGYAEPRGYAQPGGYAQHRRYPEPQGFAESRGSAESPGSAESRGYAESPRHAGPGGHAEPAGYGQGREYHDQYPGGYRGEPQFLAAPPADAGRYDTQAPGWRDDKTEPPSEHGSGGRPGRSAKTEQVTADWGPATASYRAH